MAFVAITAQYPKGKRRTRSLCNLLMKNGVKTFRKTLKVSAVVKIRYTILGENPGFRNLPGQGILSKNNPFFMG